MKTIYLGDNHNDLQMTAGYLPQTDDINKVITRSPITQRLEAFSFLTPETYHAWQLTAQAQRLAAYHGYDPQQLELETWLIGSTQSMTEGRFGIYFGDQPPQTRYRLIVHRTKRMDEHTTTDMNLWDEVAKHQIVRYSEPVSDDLTGSARSLMGQMLKAYCPPYPQSHNKVRSVLNETDHPYCHSMGFQDDLSKTSTRRTKS